MSLAAAVLLAAIAPQVATDAPREEGRGAEVETAKVSVTILRPAVLKGGTLASDSNPDAPRAQRQAEAGRVTYAFE